MTKNAKIKGHSLQSLLLSPSTAEPAHNSQVYNYWLLQRRKVIQYLSNLLPTRTILGMYVKLIYIDLLFTSRLVVKEILF